MKTTIFIFGALLTLVSSAAATKNCDKQLERADEYLAKAHNPLISDEKKSYNATIAAATLLRYKICLTERPTLEEPESLLLENIRSEKEEAKQIIRVLDKK